MRYTLKAIVYRTLTEMVLIIENEMNCTKPQEEYGITDISVGCRKQIGLYFSLMNIKGYSEKTSSLIIQKNICMLIFSFCLLVFKEGLQPLVHSRHSVNVCEINDF